MTELEKIRAERLKVEEEIRRLRGLPAPPSAAPAAPVPPAQSAAARWWPGILLALGLGTVFVLRRRERR